MTLKTAGGGDISVGTMSFPVDEVMSPNYLGRDAVVGNSDWQSDFHGMMDSFRIYGRALSDSEMVQVCCGEV